MYEKIAKFRENPIWKILVKLQEVVLVVTGILCTMIFVVEVILRYVVKVDFLGYDEWVLLFAIWLYFIGGSYAMYKKEHISADMMSLVLKGRTLQTARVVVNWVVLAITVVLAVWGVQYFSYALIRPQLTTVWKIPKLCAMSALTVGYILMALYALFYALEDTFALIERKNVPGEEGEQE